jgi:hypothetical protein
MHTRLQATQILLLYKGMHRDKIEVVLPPLRTPAAYASLILLFYMSEMSFQGREKFLPFSREKRWSPPFGGKKREIWQDRFLLLILVPLLFRPDNGNGDFPEYHQVSLSESNSG